MTVRTTRLGQGGKAKRSTRRDSQLQGMQTKKGEVRTEQSRDTAHPYMTPKMMIQRPDGKHAPMVERKKTPPKRKHQKT